MIDFIARQINSVLVKCGVVILRYPITPLPSFYSQRRRRWLNDLCISTLIDVGANTGGYASMVRREGFAGIIVSFEPLLDAYGQLQARAATDGKWLVYNYAIGDRDDGGLINVAGNSESSSLLQMGEAHLSAAPESQYIGSQSISIRRLDGIVKEGSLGDSMWLKIDTQGFESKVLAGAESVLGRVRAIELELSMTELYTGQPLIEDVVLQLRRHGFVLSAIEEEFRRATGQILQASGIFINRDYESLLKADVLDG